MLQGFGINIIKTQIKDATVFEKNYLEKFDKILIDVPCLGIGVMKRKPDIKWQRRKEDIEEITKVQYEILKNAAKYLKVGGELVYSTCSILKSENEDIIKKWLKETNNNADVEKSQNKNKYVIVSQEKIMPSNNTDGFFICKIKRTN